MSAGLDDVGGEDLVPLGELMEVLDTRRRQAERTIKRGEAQLKSLSPAPDVFEPKRWRARLMMAKDGTPQRTAGNVLTCLQNDEAFEGSLARDAFKNQWIWVKKPPADITGPWPRELRDSDVSYVEQWLEEEHKLAASLDVVGRQLGAIAEENAIDALAGYLEGLVWDGKPRIGTWLRDYLGVEPSDYSYAIGRRWLISGAARGLQRDAKADTMLILEGAQGAKKSTALKVLAGLPERKWHTDSVPADVKDKDAVLSLGGNWIVEFGELSQMGKSDLRDIKNFTQKESDKIRPPFGRMTIEIGRRCIFAGTTNQAVYLNDPTGNRRFWPVYVNDVDIPKLRNDRDQLWAEAVTCFRAGEQWWLTREESDLHAIAVDGSSIIDPWVTSLSGWAAGREVLTVAHALEVLGFKPRETPRDAEMRVANVFRVLGFKKDGQKRFNGIPMRTYIRIPPPAVTTSTKVVTEVVTEKLSDFRPVTTVTTLSEVSTYARTHARPISHTSDVGSDSSDVPDFAGENCHYLCHNLSGGSDRVPEEPEGFMPDDRGDD